MASISEVVNVALLKGGKLIEPDNINAVAVFSSNAAVFGPDKRYKLYKSSASVAEDFGSASIEAAYAETVFAQSPNPVDAGGALAFCFYRKDEQAVPASAGKMLGEPINVDKILPMLYQRADWSMDIKIDDVTKELADLDFRQCTTLDDIAGVLDAEIDGASCTSDGNQLLVTSDTTGTSSKVTTAIMPDDGEYVGVLLGIDGTSGTVVTVGADATTLLNESKKEALTAAYEQYKFGGYCFIDSFKDSDLASLGSWNQANNVLGYFTVSGSGKLEKDASNPVWALMLASQTNTRVTMSKVNNRQLACAYMARCHVVNFSAANSAMTMQLKELANVVAEDYTDTEVADAKAVGLDIYTTIKNAPLLLTSGVNEFTDNRYNLISFQNDVQTRLFNLLKGTATKIPQTEQGIKQIETAAEKECARYVTSGVFGAGEWTSTDYFGDRDSFMESIRTKGYYVLSQPLKDQTPAERQNREAPVLQVAVKNQGAVHSIDCIINFNI